MRIRSRGARKALIAGAVATMFVVSTGIVNVLAVHDVAMQLDGDVKATTGATALPYDWDSVLTTDANGFVTTKASLPSGTSGSFTAASSVVDFATTTKKGKTVFATADPTTFATGSKDTLNISTGWQCSAANNLLSKNDIMNAYAAAFTDSAGNQYMYFALERNSNNGDANVAFWFLQGDANCDSSNGTADWTGDHHDGDLLVVSAFTNGGGVSNITAYKWVGGANGFLDVNNPAGNGGDCQTATPLDPICATTNGSAAPGLDAAIPTPWFTANADDNFGHTLQPSEFFEGGINLTNTGFGNKCFNTFVGDTRSSQSPTATIFDYARGRLGECTSTTGTQAKDGNDQNLTTVAIPATGTLAIKDTATVTVTGVNAFSGTVQFYLCGPSTTQITTCSSSGTAIGGTHTVTANGSVDQTASLTSAGYYCWHAVFSGDSVAGVPGSEDNSSNECFRVTPLQPTLPTQATSGPVDFGSSISDTVTPTGTANKPGTNGIGPGGTINATRGGVDNANITLTAYAPDCTTVAYGPVTLPANGNAAVGGAGTTFEFTPSAPGQYTFVASLAADSPNTLGVAAVTCTSQPSNEKVTVRQIPTQIATGPSYFPQDSATLTSSISGNSLPAGGSVVFRLYDSQANCQAHGDTVGSGGLLYKQTVTLGAAATTQTAATNNTTVRVTAASSTLYWRVTYAPGDTAHTGSQSDCVENITSTIGGDAGPGSLFP